MSNDVRARIVAPILIPVGILVVMAGFIGTVASLLLYSTNAGALTFAAVAAGGILFTVSLATSQERLDAPRRLAIAVAALLPFVAGGAVALGLVGDIAEEDRMINVPPLLFVPEDAPRLAAANSLEYCAPVDAATCDATATWEVLPSAEVETIAFVFENREAGVPHNIVITELEGTPDAPGAGTVLVESDIISGVADDYHVEDVLTWDDLPEQWYFFCRVHANMNGVGTVTAAG
ncbi:MAG: hypothetical protein RLZZ272_555 [Actinomycetota bacterium]